MAPGAQSNSNILKGRGRGVARDGAEQDRRETAPNRGYPLPGAVNGRLAPPQQNARGPHHEIEPLTRSSRGSLPRTGLRAGATGSPDRSLHTLSASFAVTLPSDGTATTAPGRASRPVSPLACLLAHEIAQVGPADGGVKLRRVDQGLALSPQCDRPRRMRDGLGNRFTHHRIPSLVRRNMPAAALGRTGNVSRKIP